MHAASLPAAHPYTPLRFLFLQEPRHRLCDVLTTSKRRKRGAFQLQYAFRILFANIDACLYCGHVQIPFYFSSIQLPCQGTEQYCDISASIGSSDAHQDMIGSVLRIGESVEDRFDSCKNYKCIVSQCACAWEYSSIAAHRHRAQVCIHSAHT